MKTYLGNEAPLPGTNAKAHPVDVVFHLGRTKRFGGWSNPEWSVLHHSMLVAMLYMKSYGVKGMEHALLHDAHEAYTGDIPTPVKNILGQEEVKSLENHLDQVIRDSLNLNDDINHNYIKICDLAALFIESYHFGDKAGPFLYIGEKNWQPLAPAWKTNIASVIKRSCPEIYNAMLVAREYNTAWEVHPWGVE